jgi:hypothetical protein
MVAEDRVVSGVVDGAVLGVDEALSTEVLELEYMLELESVLELTSVLELEVDDEVVV